MIRVDFSNPVSFNQIAIFDGEVLEVFGLERSSRYHIAHIKSIEVNTDRKGNYSLKALNTSNNTIVMIMFDQADLPKVNELVAEVKKAGDSFKL